MANRSVMTSAFVLHPGLHSRNVFASHQTCRKVPKRVNNRVQVRACIPNEKRETPPDAEVSLTTPKADNSEKSSKTAQIAAMLGQDTKKMKAEAERVKQEVNAENRRKYGLALTSIIVSSTLFFTQYLDPNSAVNLMQYMAKSSTPVNVVGTNGKPTLIEFSATWCENCKYMARRVFELENEYAGLVNFVVIDGEDPHRMEIVDKYGVDAIPQFSMISKDGNVQTNLVGLVPKSVLASDLDALLKDDILPFKGLSLEELRGP